MTSHFNHGQLVKAALTYLEYKQREGYKIYFFPSASGKVRLDSGRYFRTGKPGCPDITISYQGYIGIEIKVGKDSQSDEQKKAQKEIEESGGKYIICHDSLENLRRIFGWQK